MPSKFIVRPTAESDLPAVTAIYSDAVRAGAASLELKSPDVAEMTRRWRSRVSAGYPHIVAQDGAEIVGYASARRYRPSLAFKFVVEDSVYVAFSEHGRGIGGALLAELIQLCGQSGYRQMIAVIGDGNVASVGLHERLGFRSVGTLEQSAFKDGRSFDVFLMQRTLGESSKPPYQG